MRKTKNEMRKVAYITFVMLYTLIGYGQNLKCISITDILKDETGNYILLEEKDFENIKNTGFNTVRIELTSDMSAQGRRGTTLSSLASKYVKSMTSLASQHGLKTIIALRESTSEKKVLPVNSVWKDLTKQSLFNRLWTDMAKKFKLDSNIIGFDPIPAPNKFTKEEHYHMLSKNTLKAIRQTNQDIPVYMACNTILFDKIPQEIIDDPNVILNFRFFEPSNFSLQKTELGSKKLTEHYPDPKHVEYPEDLVYKYSETGDSVLLTGSKDMFAYNTKIAAVNDEEIVAGKVVIEATNIGSDGELILLSVLLTEYDSEGKSIGTPITLQLSNVKNWDFYAEGKGSYKILPQYTFDQKDAVRIENTDAYTTLTTDELSFPVTYGHQYEASCFVKPSFVDFEGTALCRIDFQKSSSGLKPIKRDSTLILDRIERIEKKAEALNKKVAFLECGTSKNTQKAKHGGLIYLKDLVEVFQNKSFDFGIISFDGEAFGCIKGKKGKKELVQYEDFMKALKN